MDNNYGIYQAIVTNIQDPEKRGRIRVVCPDVMGDAESAWCEPVSPVAYDGGGDICIPALEEAVWIMFIGGDVERPVYLGGWWSESSTPFGDTYSDAENTRVVSFDKVNIRFTQEGLIIYIDGTQICKISSEGIDVNGDLNVDGDIHHN